LERSLTVLLPVQNAQAGLSAAVHGLLDVLPELTERFEVLIVDDGATEAASEAAHDLAKDYPQVRVVRQGAGSGREVAVQLGLQRSNGDVVVLGEPDCGARVQEIVRLWRTVDAGNRSFPLGQPGAPHRVSADEHGEGFRVLKGREAAERVEGRTTHRTESGSVKGRPNFLGHLRRFALGE
jgi:glycosyltransferase involved in cell wall biosynthesis